MDAKLCVFVIDDVPMVLPTLERVPHRNGFGFDTVASPAPFFERPPPYDGLARLLLDPMLSERNGLDVQATLTERGIRHPTAFFGGHDDVPTKARAMRSSAPDLLLNPLDQPQLLEALNRTNARPGAGSRLRTDRQMGRRLACPSKRQRQLLPSRDVWIPQQPDRPRVPHGAQGRDSSSWPRKAHPEHRLDAGGVTTMPKPSEVPG
jgi:two-component system response regulator FixJ